MDSCVFCKIVHGEIPSFQIAEDENHVAFLDVNPNTEGASLVATKKHYNSDFLELGIEHMNEAISFAYKVCAKLKSSLGVERVGLAVEGMGVNHFHIKLYPFHGLDKKFKTMETDQAREFFTDYPGYMTTKLGPQADMGELKRTGDKITKLNNKA